MRTSLLVLGCLISVSAFAGPGSLDRISEKADRIAMDIRYRGRDLSDSQIQQINKELDSIRSIMENGYGGGGNGNQGDYICVSRDNDNAAPFALASRSGVNVTRLKAIYNSMQACEQARSSMRWVGNVAIICASRDNDGAEPATMSLLNGNQQIVLRAVLSMNECQQSLRSARFERNGMVSICASRDADAAQPYSPMSVDLRNGSLQKGSESYGSLEACYQFFQ